MTDIVTDVKGFQLTQRLYIRVVALDQMRSYIYQKFAILILFFFVSLKVLCILLVISHSFK